MILRVSGYFKNIYPITSSVSNAVSRVTVLYSLCPLNTYHFSVGVNTASDVPRLLTHKKKPKNEFLIWPGGFQRTIYYHCLWSKLSTTCSNATDVAQRAAPSCSQPQSATNNGVRDGRFN